MFYDRDGAPSLDTVLWRYMDLAKYLSLLQHSALYFSRPRGLKNLDPWEGYVGPSPVLDRGQWEAWVRRPYVNSWHVSQDESAAMWQIYQGRGFGVAIRSVWKNLSRAFTDQNEHVWGGLVRYVDYISEVPDPKNIYTPLFMKRAAFEFEKEARLLVQSSDENGPDGREITVDVPALIEEVIVSPYEPPWVADLVSHLTHERHPGIPVNRSGLLADPPSS